MLSRFELLEVRVQGFVVLEVASCNPEVVFRAITCLAYEIFDVVASEFLVVEDAGDAVFRDIVH